MAILSTLCCCLPLGVVSIVHAAKVNSLYYSGNYNAAQEEADEAKEWAKCSAIVAVILYVSRVLYLCVE